MTTERIEQIRDSKQRAYNRQFDNYQSTGEQKYYTKMHAYDELIEICNLALIVNNPRQELGSIKASLCDLADKADTVIHKHPEGYFMPLQPSDLKEFYLVLKDLIAVAETHGYDSKWR